MKEDSPICVFPKEVRTSFNLFKFIVKFLMKYILFIAQINPVEVIGRGMCYPVCRMVHIKEPLLLIGKSSPCGSTGFLSRYLEWSSTICPMPYNRK